jgi:hypothetical protein
MLACGFSLHGYFTRRIIHDVVNGAARVIDCKLDPQASATLPNFGRAMTASG